VGGWSLGRRDMLIIVIQSNQIGAVIPSEVKLDQVCDSGTLTVPHPLSRTNCYKVYGWV